MERLSPVPKVSRGGSKSDPQACLSSFRPGPPVSPPRVWQEVTLYSPECSYGEPKW